MYLFVQMYILNHGSGSLFIHFPLHLVVQPYHSPSRLAVIVMVTPSTPSATREPLSCDRAQTFWFLEVN